MIKIRISRSPPHHGCSEPHRWFFNQELWVGWFTPWVFLRGLSYTTCHLTLCWFDHITINLCHLRYSSEDFDSGSFTRKIIIDWVPYEQHITKIWETSLSSHQREAVVRGVKSHQFIQFTPHLNQVVGDIQRGQVSEDIDSIQTVDLIV